MIVCENVSPEVFSVTITEGFFLLAFWKGAAADLITVMSELNNTSSAAVSVSHAGVIKASEGTRDQTHQEV